MPRVHVTYSHAITDTITVDIPQGDYSEGDLFDAVQRAEPFIELTEILGYEDATDE